MKRVEDQLRVAASGQAQPSAGATSEPGATGTSGATGIVPVAPAPLSDEEVTARIQSKYYSNDDLRASSIDVATASGVVRLSGTVESDARREQAEAIARGTNGVLRVDNQLKVLAPTEGVEPVQGRVPPPPVGDQPAGTSVVQQGRLAEPIDDAWITTSIQSRFFLDDKVKNGAVNVVTENGTVTLTGTVTDAAAKRQAVRIAQTTAGVARVIDKLTLAR